MKINVYVVDFELSPRTKRWSLRLGVLALLLASGAAVAYAAVPKTWVDGDTLKAAELNENFDALDKRITALAQPGSAMRAISTVQQSLPNAVWTTVTFGTTQFDLGSEYKAATGIFTPKGDGIYAVSCQLEIMSPTGNDHAVSIVVNNARVATGGLIVADIAGVPTVSSVLQLHATDQVRCDAYQSSGSGGPARTLNGQADRNFLSIAKLY